MSKPPLVIEHLPTGALRPYACNARTHSPKQIAQIAASICEFGFNNPVLIDRSAEIIAGHPRLLEAQGARPRRLRRLGHDAGRSRAHRPPRRRGVAIEIDPVYCDVIVRRLAKVCGLTARLEATGQPFDEVAALRRAEAPAEEAA